LIQGSGSQSARTNECSEFISVGLIHHGGLALW
jgi:hypothetical protein